jgi:hypothetical protein
MPASPFAAIVTSTNLATRRVKMPAFRLAWMVGAVVLAAMFAPVATYAQETSVKNIVLVHGAWADGSGWQKVYEALKARGYNVSIV